MSSSSGSDGPAAASPLKVTPPPQPKPHPQPQQQLSQPPAQPTPSPHLYKPATLSASELRTGMQQHFRTNGTLQQLKTQLRGMILTDLLQQPKAAQMLVAGTAQSTPPSLTQSRLEDRPVPSPNRPAPFPFPSPSMKPLKSRADPALQTWSCGLADALVENHLRRTRRAMSLSIFSTEAEVPPFSTSGAPSEEEQYLTHLFRQTGQGTSGGVDSSPEAEDDILAPSPSRPRTSVLQRLVEDAITKYGAAGAAAAEARHLHSCSTQTNAADSTDGATNPLNSLECRLAAVDAKYALTFAQLKRCGATGEQPFFLRSEVERRLAQYKADTHAQLRSEYEQKYNTFTRVQLQEARDAAAEHYRLLLSHKTAELAEMERSTVVKMDQERARLKLSWDDVRQQRQEMERRQRDMAKQAADHDAALLRKEEELQKGKDTCRVLQLQCAKWEELCATRLMELDGARSREARRVEDLRRMQAEHAAELQLKEEEMGRLRYRLRLLTREMEAPVSSEKENGAPRGAVASNGPGAAVAPTLSTALGANAALDPQQLYGLLLRTEELQRNAVVQQQQQQQRWDAAWVAAGSTTPTGAPPHDKTMPLAPTTAPAAVSSPAAHIPAPCVNGDATDVQRETNTAAAGAAAVSSPSSSSDSPAPTPAPTAHSSKLPQPAGARTSALPSTATDLVKKTEKKAPASASVSRSSKSKSSNDSGTSKQKRDGAVTSSKPSSTTAPTSTTAASAASSPSSSASENTIDATSLAVTPQKPSAPPRSDTPATPPISQEAFANVQEAEQMERETIVEDEDTARSGIVWAEENKRAIVQTSVAQTRRQRSDDDSDASSSSSGGGGGGVTRPWDRPSAGLAISTTHPPDNTLFNDSFGTDDDALIHSADEDDSDF